jgi:hypothetical protein
MIGRIINYGTDKLLPEEYRYIGDYACAAIDAAQGDYASAAAGVLEGISQNLNQAGCEKGAVAAEIAGQAAGAARGDINSAITGKVKDEALLKAGAKMGAVGAAACGGAAIDGKNGARTGATLAQGSIGTSLKDTAIKSSFTAGGAIAGRQIKHNNNGLIQGASLSQHTGLLISDSKDIIESQGNQTATDNATGKNDLTGGKSKSNLEDLNKVKNDTINVYKDQKKLREDDPRTRNQMREAIKDNLKLDIIESSSNATIASGKLVEEGVNNNKISEQNVDTIIDLATEIGKTGSSVCRIRETKVEIEDKTYKITDTLCYTGSNYRDIKREFEETNKRFQDKK